MVKVILTERDDIILREIARWRGCLGRQIKKIGGFTGTRTTDARLKKLVDNGYLKRKRYVYGVAGIYQITPFTKRKLGLDVSISQIRLDQIDHDIAVVDTYLYFKDKYKLKSKDVISEKEFRHEQGFVTRGHAPDFLFKHRGKLNCVEVEFSEKAKDRLEKNVKDNYVKYNSQYFILGSNSHRVKKWLEDFAKKYPNITIVKWEVICDYTKDV